MRIHARGGEGVGNVVASPSAPVDDVRQMALGDSDSLEAGAPISQQQQQLLYTDIQQPRHRGEFTPSAESASSLNPQHGVVETPSAVG